MLAFALLSVLSQLVYWSTWLTREFRHLIVLNLLSAITRNHSTNNVLLSVRFRMMTVPRIDDQRSWGCLREFDSCDVMWEYCDLLQLWQSMPLHAFIEAEILGKFGK